MKHNLAISVDDNYIQHACVMLTSLNAHLSENVAVYCLYRDLSAKNRNILEEYFRKSWITLQFVEFIKTDIAAFPIKRDDHVTESAFFRIWLPQLLPQVNEVLFLDVDIVITGDISHLFHLSIEELPLAAVEDIGMTTQKKIDLGMSESSSYFNSGVMKMNLDYFRKNALTSKLENFIINNPEKCEFWDQDALNAVIDGHFLKLDFKYNVQGVFFERFSHELKVKAALKGPAIVHFTGGGICKPWFYRNQHPLKSLYYQYLYFTPFKHFIPIGMPKAKRLLIKIKYLFKSLS